MYKLILSVAASLCLTLSANAQKTYEYAQAATEQGNMSLMLDFYSGGGTCAAPRPTVIYIHGGGFRGGNRNFASNKGYAQAFTAAGINLVSISYRLAGDLAVLSAPYQRILDSLGDVSSQENYPGQVKASLGAFEDTVSALEYVVANANRDCVDTREIFLMGSSAGGVAALNVAYGLDDVGIRRPSIEGVMDLWGGGLPAERIAAGNVPLFIVHGEKDTTVPFAFAESYWQRATAVGVPVQLHAFKNRAHGVNLNRSRVDGTPTIDLAIKFVQDIAAGDSIETVRTRN